MHKALLSIFIVTCVFAFGQNQNSSNNLFSKKAIKLYDLGKHEDVLVYADSIHQNLLNPENSLDSLEYATICHLKGKSLFELSQYSNSIEVLHEGRKYAEPLYNSKDVLSGIFYFLHVNYGVQLKLFECIKYGDLSINILENLEDPNYDLLLKLYGRMAVYTAQAGDYSKAYNYMEKGEKLLESLPSKAQLSTPKVSYKVKLLYRKILVGFISQVLMSNSDSVSLFLDDKIKNDKHQLDSIFLYNKNVVKKGNNKFLYDNDTYYYALALNYYAYYYASKKQSKVDINTLHLEIDKAISLLQKKYYKRHLYQFKSTKAKLYQKQNEHDKALALFDEIIDNTDDNNNNRSNFYIYKGLVLFETNNIDEGKKLIHKALSVIHSGSDSLKKDFSNFKAGYKFNDVISLSNLTKNINQLKYNFKNKEEYVSALNNLAFKQFIDTYKAQGLNKVTNNFFKVILKRLIESNGMSNDYLSKVENIENHFAWKQFNQNRNVVQLPVVDSLENIEYQLRKQLATAKRKRNNKVEDSMLVKLKTHQNNIKKYYPKIFNFSQDDFKIQEFQNNLRLDEVLLKYLFFDDKFVVFQITKDNVTHQLKPFRVEEKTLLNAHIEQIKNKNSTLNYDDKLTKLLLPQQVIKKYQKIIIVPDTPIFQLPFETLKYNDKFLFEDKVIRYSSHLRFVFFNKKTATSEDALVSIFAPEYIEGKPKLAVRSSNYFLEGAQQEANTISEIFESDSYFGSEATKFNFVENKAKANIIHLAMHATLDKEEPELSHFNFTNNEKLYIEELYGLKIPAELAVLSACNTGVGYNNNDGETRLKSLQHAFNYAGTKATVASVWEVPDNATSMIMIAFYENLKKGQTKSVALQRAKRTYLNTTDNLKLKHPYYWAGFVLYGDDAPVVEESKSYLILIFGGLTIAGLVFQYFRSKRKRVA